MHLGDSTGEILRRLDACAFDHGDVGAGSQAASAFDYSGRVRDTGSSEPTRYNANARRLHGASGCAGKVAAVRLDTFERPEAEQTSYLASNDPGDMARLRRDLLTEVTTLPVSA